MKKNSKRIQFTVRRILKYEYRPFYDHYEREVYRALLLLSDTNGNVYEWLTGCEVREGAIVSATPLYTYGGGITRITQGRIRGYAEI